MSSEKIKKALRESGLIIPSNGTILTDDQQRDCTWSCEQDCSSGCKVECKQSEKSDVRVTVEPEPL